MRIEKTKEFSPITVTLENEEELFMLFEMACKHWSQCLGLPAHFAGQLKDQLDTFIG